MNSNGPDSHRGLCRWKNGLYDIGFSQNDCFFSIPLLFIYGLYANILRDFYVMKEDTNYPPSL